jgi:carboxyl-terminal processing protease
MDAGGRAVRGVWTLAIVAVSACAAFCLGFSLRDLSSLQPPDARAFARLLGLERKPEQTPTELFADHYRRILATAYEPLPADRLKYRAMEGMFASLGDPHTNFLEPVAAEGLKLETRGDFVGIGARLSPDPIGARIVTVFRGSPAEKAGLKPNDVVVGVDGKDSAGEEVTEVVERIRGKAGTAVQIKILRPGQRQPIQVRIVRAVVAIPTAEGRMLPGTNVAYLSVTQFAETTPIQFTDTLRGLVAQRPKGLVIDMRGNPGGLLPAVAEMLGAFLDGKEVVTMRRRLGIKQTAVTPRGKTLSMPFPVVVLVNEDSASAAEIFAGALQDYQHATIVGEHTYGKASVQTVFNLADRSSAKVTMARYYLPSGRNIERKVDEDGQYLSGGLKPDVAASLDLEASSVLGEPGNDSQLDAAIQEVHKRAKR